MLTFFPDPYNDELLYSMICRYHILSGNIYDRDTVYELFVNRNQRMNIRIPARLSVLAEQTKAFGITFDQMLYDHTLFPYYTLFLKQKKIDALYNQANNCRNQSGSIEIPRYTYMAMPNLRYCPVCREEERQLYGESYWHRSHQIENIWFCSKHKVPLINSNINHVYTAKKILPVGIAG
jgi:hypothetical protein